MLFQAIIFARQIYEGDSDPSMERLSRKKAPTWASLRPPACFGNGINQQTARVAMAPALKKLND
jgi:hypothetical protein